ncbi:hypothetical protein B9Z19DRAFT_1071030 [Tuber borchii]|uniref:Uncharacterized protein n=1 Tax=Tuber borchii TaxID=42251 RepID=A0A2T7A8Q1_TUBBO|nr:hypothetical protein B9Z19DRAFT_1071030 [Tuber borchii]
MPPSSLDQFPTNTLSTPVTPPTNSDSTRLVTKSTTSGGYRVLTSIMSSSSLSPPSDTDMELNEPDLLQRLRQRRKELDAEIEAFRALKESEYKAFERKLREEYELRERKQGTESDNEGGQISKNNNATTTDASPPYATVANTATSGPENGNICSTWAGVERGSQVPPGVGEPTLDDALRLELPNAPSAQLLKNYGNNSPPFDKDLQAAFTPRYLPLLDKNYQSPPSPPSNKIMSSPPQSPKPALPRIATIPGRSGNSPGSPAAPLASSLKSSSGSSFGTTGKSTGIKQKSPKRVTFQFEDESSVPSRSSPPPAKVHWSLADDRDSEYGLEDDDESVGSTGGQEVVGAGEELGGSGKVAQIGNAAKLLNREMTQGVELVVPTTLPETSTESKVLVDDSFEEVQFGDEMSGNRSKEVNGDLEGVFDTETMDDDEEDLFDMDETVAEREESPPHRDYAALLNTTKPPPQRSPFSGQSFPPLPSFTPIPASAPAPQADLSLTFGKALGMRSGFTAVRGGISASFNPSLSLEPITSRALAGEEPHTAPIASSLPNIGWEEISGKGRSVPTPGGRFRRRSIAKYDVPDEDDVPKGKSHPNIPEEDEPPLKPFGRSPGAASLPMAIARNSPLAALSGSTSSKSPTPLRKYASPATIPEVPDEAPVSGRPSPVPPPLATDLVLNPGVESIKQVSSADILAEMPASEPPSSTTAKNDSVSSYRLTSPFPSASVLPTASPYRTAYAAEVAASAFDGELESVVGGVDGRTGLDPDVSSFQAAPGTSINRRRGSVILPQEVRPERMSLGMRMAFEEMKGKKWS